VATTARMSFDESESGTGISKAHSGGGRKNHKISGGTKGKKI
jgi:hypothetical protein